jgi:hypothetical protein
MGPEGKCYIHTHTHLTDVLLGAVVLCITTPSE